MIKVLLHSQAEQISSHINARIMSHIQRGQVNKFECYDRLNLMSFDWYDIQAISTQPSQIIIVFTTEHLFFLCEDEKCLQHVQQLLNKEGSHDRVLYDFFVELIKGDIEYLEDMEEYIAETEDRLLTSSNRAKPGEIIALRRTLLNLKKYYEQLNQIFEGLVENENNLISREDLRYFRILNSKIDRLFANILNLRDYVTQIREAYQAQLDIEQNNLMRIFTVVAFIFMPLTFIVGWYGMNLDMPELSWPYTYPFVIFLSIVIAIFCFFYFKRRKWF